MFPMMLRCSSFPYLALCFLIRSSSLFSCSGVGFGNLFIRCSILSLLLSFIVISFSILVLVFILPLLELFDSCLSSLGHIYFKI